jgi:hypothetical protein
LCICSEQEDEYICFEQLQITQYFAVRIP